MKNYLRLISLFILASFAASMVASPAAKILAYIYDCNYKFIYYPLSMTIYLGSIGLAILITPKIKLFWKWFTHESEIYYFVWIIPISFFCFFLAWCRGEKWE